jgi:WD40 repeat protein
MRRLHSLFIILFTLTTAGLLSCSPDPHQEPSVLLYLHGADTSILHLPSGETETVASGLIPVNWSPSGTLLLRGEDRIHLFTSDPSPDETTFSLQGLDCQRLEEAAWLNDSVILLRGSAGAQSCLYAYSVPDGQMIHSENNYTGFDLLPSPAGSFWIQRTLKGLEVRSLEGERTILPGLDSSYQPGLQFDLAFSPDGAQLAYYSGGILWAAGIDVNGLHQPEPLYQPEAFMPDLAWSPDGQMLAYLEYDRSISQPELQILDADDGTLLHQWAWPGRGSQLLWSPSSQKILSCAEAPFQMDIETGEIGYPFGSSAFEIFLLYDWRAEAE